MIPDFVAERIQKPCPEGCEVVKGSTPVVSFGDFTRARVATVAINPSSREFLDRDGSLLVKARRRLATLKSLGCDSLSNADQSIVETVWTDCQRYFVGDRNPYMKWFGPLEKFLGDVGASYLDGSACHLDLVQWATPLKWSGVPATEKAVLLSDGLSFLRRQLSVDNLQLVLLNGREVIDTLSNAGVVSVTTSERITNGKKSGGYKEGMLFDSIPFIGWTLNLQSSHGTSEHWSEVCSRLASFAKRNEE